MDMVGHCVSFQYLNSFLLTQISKNPPYRGTQLAIHHFPAILRDEYYVVLALPTNVRQRFEFFHALFLLAQRGFLEMERILFTP